MTNYPFVYNDGGRATSKRPLQKNDCTVRALAIATGMPYDTVYDILKDAGRQCSGRFNIKQFLFEPHNQDFFNCKFHWQSFPAVKGECRMNPVAFSKQFNQGIYIAKTAKHVFTFIDGVAQDVEAERDDRCIYAAWKVEKPK